MILRKRVEEIPDLVKKTENEIACSGNIVIGDVYIGAGIIYLRNLFFLSHGGLSAV